MHHAIIFAIPAHLRPAALENAGVNAVPLSQLHLESPNMEMHAPNSTMNETQNICLNRTTQVSPNPITTRPIRRDY